MIARYFLLLFLVAQGLPLSCCPAMDGRSGGETGAAAHESCFLRRDYQQLPRPDGAPRRSHYRARFDSVLSGFLAGVGDRVSSRLEGNTEFFRHHEWARQNGAPINAQAVWLTRDWDESWVSRDDLERMARDGVVPVLILYYFAHDISRRHVLAHREEWFFYLTKVAALASIDYPVLVVLEPEFNDATNEESTLILSWPGFNEIIIDGIYVLRSLAPNVLVGICPGDFGMQDLEPAIGEVAQYSDFIAFQEMRASTRPSLVSNDYEDVTERTLAYATYLQKTFHKPILLAYLAVSTHDPDVDRWEQHQASIISHVMAKRRDLAGLGVFGLLYFMLFDDPAHEGFFGPAEPHFGLVDKFGKPKAGWHAFREAVEKARGELVRLPR